MKLYNLPPGMNPRRVRIFLAEKGVEVPTVDIDMMKGENRTPEFLAMNPMGTLPVLELDDGTILSESIAICRYIEHLHPEPPLFGRTPLEEAQVEMWNRRMEHEIMVPITAVFRHGHEFWKGSPQVPDYAELARQQATERMIWLDGHLAGREFIATDDYTVADITAQCALLLGRNTGTPIPEDAPNLARWWQAVTARPTARA
jgi:glutathione S-transferase